MIQADVEGVGTLEFPDDTDPAVIQQTVKKMVAQRTETTYQQSTGKPPDEGVLEPGVYPGKGLVGNLLTGLFDPGVLLDPSNLVGGAGAGAWTGRTAKAAGKGALDMLTGGYGLIHGFGKGVAQGLKTRGMTPQPTTLPLEVQMVVEGKAPAFLKPPVTEGTIPTVGEQALQGASVQGIARQTGMGYFKGKDGTEVIFNPDLTKTSALKALDKKGALAEIVNGPGTSPKPVAPTEAVVARTPEGTEIRTILTDTPEKTTAAVKAQPAGTQVEVKPFDEAGGVLQERMQAFRSNVEDARTSIPTGKQYYRDQEGNIIKTGKAKSIREYLSGDFPELMNIHADPKEIVTAIDKDRGNKLYLQIKDEIARQMAREKANPETIVTRPTDFDEFSRFVDELAGQEKAAASPVTPVPIGQQPKLFQTQAEMPPTPLQARAPQVEHEDLLSGLKPQDPTRQMPLMQGATGGGAEEIAAAERAAGYSPLVQPRLRTKVTKEAIGAVTDFMKTEGLTVDPEGPRLFQQLAEHIGGAKERLPRLVQLFEQRGLHFERDLKEALNESATESGRVLQIYSQAAKALEAGAQTPAKVRLRDMFYEAWLNGLVSAPASHVANVVGNTLTKLTLTGERGIAAGLDLAVSKLTGTPRTRYAGEVKADVFGSIQGMKLGLARAVKAFREEATGAQKVEYAPAIPGKTGKVVRTPTRALGAMDEFFKSISEQAELSALAFRKAKGEGLSGEAFSQRVGELIKTPPKEWAKPIIQYGEYATFNNPLGKFGAALMEARNHHLLAKMIAPFMRTPTNIAKATLKRTPAGLAYTSLQIAKGKLKGGDAMDALASGVMGSLIGAGTVLLAAEGHITGGGPTDRRVNNLLRETGWLPYAVTDGKTYVPINRLEPVSSIIGMAADFVEAFDEKQPQKMMDLATKFSASIGENMTNKTFLVGIENAFQAFIEPKRFFEYWAKGMAGSLVPNILGSAARAVDPTMRETSLETAPLAKIPFASKTLPARQSVFGEEIKRPGGAVERFLSPAVSSSLRPDREVEAEAARLGLALRPPREEVSLGKGVKVSRTTGEQRVFQRQSGQLAKQLLREAINWNGYQTLPDEIKRDLFTRTITKSRAATKAQQIPSAAHNILNGGR